MSVAAPKAAPIPDQNLEAIILKKLDDLPTLPNIVYELSRVINDPMSSTGEVERIMQNDIAMTAKVLKLANSAYYAIPGGVSSLSRAIAYIGFDTVNQLVLSASIINALDSKGPSTFDINLFWQHSIGVGISAETIAKYIKHPMPSDLFTCGLVHDMGKIAVYQAAPEEFVGLSQFAQESGQSLDEAEAALHFPRHADIGLQLAAKWLLPRQIQAVIQYHHQPDPRRRGGISGDLSRSVDIVLLGNLLTHALKFGNSGHTKVLGAPTEVMRRLMIDPNRDFKPLIQEIKSNLERAGEFIKLIRGGA